MSSLLSGREILVVDDEPLLRRQLARFLEKEGASVTSASTFEEGKNLFLDMSFDFAMCDVHLGDGLGLDLLEFASGVTVVIMTADGGWEVAVEAMKRGAADYVAKPFELQEIPLILARCEGAKRSDRSRQHRLKQENGGEGKDIFFGESLAGMKAQLDRVLAADRRLEGRLPPVLIGGETGTGKSTIAKWLHAKGPRKDKELVVVNCAALPENLAESELFGHEKGAFTDAKEARMGLFEAADGGTLFLDEIASLSLPLQAKVLVAVEEGKIRKVGGSREVEVDTRLIAAANLDLKELAAEGKFREDLYHRLNLLEVRIPPLRDRRADLPALVEYLLEGRAGRYRLDGPSVSKKGMRQLLGYDWPGNIRELSHELERAIILGDPDGLEFPALAGVSGAAMGNEEFGGATGEDWLDPVWEFPLEGFDLEEAIDRLVNKAIDQAGGNVSKAARFLGVQRDYIRYRQKKKKV
ncbi:MAG: sigma-54 dependent transcriptional regulator, partial [Verrucomicrobiota bacterium]